MQSEDSFVSLRSQRTMTRRLEIIRVTEKRRKRRRTPGFLYTFCTHSGLSGHCGLSGQHRISKLLILCCGDRLDSCRAHRLAARGLYLNWPSLGSRACDPAMLCQELFPVFRIPKSFRTS